MNRLFQRQLAQATGESGSVDLELLADLVTTAYEDADRDRIRTDRSISLMADELQSANSRMLEAFTIVPEGLVLLDAAGRFVLFNQTFVALNDTAADKIAIGRKFSEFIRTAVERGHYLDAIGREEEWLAERLGQGKSNSTEQAIVGNRWVRLNERRTPDGGSISVLTEITQFKHREELLKKRSEQLVEAQRLGKTGDWSYRFGDNKLWWSPQAYELLGYDPAAGDTLPPPSWGDDADRVLASQAEVMRSRRTSTVDVKIKRGDGTIADVVVTSKLMIGANGEMAGITGAIQDISDRKIAEEKLKSLAYFDPLTGLANRALFHREINDVLTHCGQTGTQAALLLLDLDRFKEVNDSLGHLSGDELLTKVAQLISRLIGNRGFFARLGGDEFAILMRDCGDRIAVAGIGGSIIEAVSGPVRLDRGEVNISTSIGVAMIPEDGKNAMDLQRNADLALYRAKENGRACMTFFQIEMNEIVQQKAELARELRRAITENLGLKVHYQPQVSLLDRQVVGFEALLRWNHPTLGDVSPAKFVPIAESSQLICDLGIWVLRQAVVQAKSWLDAGEPPRKISVNVSSAQIWQTDFPGDVSRILLETGFPPHLLCLELTESLLVDYAEGRARNVLSALKELGVELALDDFGTDYSSLGYLTQLPFDQIKIDRVFVDGIARSERARKLLGGIVALGRGLGMTVVTEGVESAEELAVVEQFGCDLVQGYVFSPAVAAQAALEFARSPTASVLPGEADMVGEADFSMDKKQRLVAR